MRETAVGAAISMLVVMVVFVSIAACIPDPKATVAQAHIDKPARFKQVGTVIFDHRVNGQVNGEIYKDRETDIEYMYIWDGASNGGPAITRLWKKGE